MCNLYSITTNQGAIIALFRVDACVYRESKSERIDDEARPR
jgi:hypothetical protein